MITISFFFEYVNIGLNNGFWFFSTFNKVENFPRFGIEVLLNAMLLLLLFLILLNW